MATLLETVLCSGAACMALAIALPGFEAAGKRTGCTFRQATSVLGETAGGGSCSNDGPSPSNAAGTERGGAESSKARDSPSARRGARSFTR